MGQVDVYKRQPGNWTERKTFPEVRKSAIIGLWSGQWSCMEWKHGAFKIWNLFLKLIEEFFGKFMAPRKPKMGTGIDPKKSCTGIWKIWKRLSEEKDRFLGYMVWMDRSRFGNFPVWTETPKNSRRKLWIWVSVWTTVWIEIRNNNNGSHVYHLK